VAALRWKWRGLPFWFFALLALCLGGAVYQAYTLFRLNALNRAIADPSGLRVDERSPPALVFAKAHWLARAGERQEATRLYSTLLHSADKTLRVRALHNLATIYLQDGAGLWNARGVLEYARVNTLLELAKENYREALRLDPDNWDARLNLEYAYRITPPPKERPKSDWTGTKTSVFSTLPGIPGGGP
jgi:mxaK protein